MPIAESAKAIWIFGIYSLVWDIFLCDHQKIILNYAVGSTTMIIDQWQKFHY